MRKDVILSSYWLALANLKIDSSFYVVVNTGIINDIPWSMKESI